MTHVLGRRPDEDGASGPFGRYRAADGSAGARVALDVERPHAALVVGKRGHGKSYTLGVLAENVARADGTAGIVVDPLGAFGALDAGVDARTVPAPRIAADALPPRAWCDLLGLDPTSAAGGLVWRAAAEAATLDGIDDRVADADATGSARRAARNHLALARSWDVFDPAGLDAASLLDGTATVLDLSGRGQAPANAVCRAVAETLYGEATRSADCPLPWLLVDEAQTFAAGVAAPAIRTLLTRGRKPGVSTVLATQRPSALPDVAVSQADLLVAHRLTSRADVSALAAARPTYLGDPFGERLPDGPGEAVVVDDATEAVHAVRVRERDTPHGGASPRASDRAGRGVE